MEEEIRLRLYNLVTEAWANYQDEKDPSNELLLVGIFSGLRQAYNLVFGKEEGEWEVPYWEQGHYNS